TERRLGEAIAYQSPGSYTESIGPRSTKREACDLWPGSDQEVQSSGDPVTVHALDYMRMKCCALGREIKSLVAVYQRNLIVRRQNSVASRLGRDLRTSQQRMIPPRHSPGRWVPGKGRKRVAACRCDSRLWRQVFRNVHQ